MSKQKKPKKAKEPFWKRHPELKSITDHIGKAADNMKFNDWADLAIIVGTAYIGYDMSKSWKGALVGPIAYKLATTMGGTPPVSQISGLIVLGSMGLATLAPSILDELQKQIVPTEVLENMGKPEYWPKEWWGYIPFAEDFMRLLEERKKLLPSLQLPGLP